MTPVQLAAQLWSVDPATLTAIRIKNGLTNESYHVSGGPEEVVVRLSVADEHALQLDRTSEAHVLKLVEQAQIGATVLHCDPDTRVLITRKLPGRNLELAETHSDAGIENIARLLRQLHALPAPASAQTTDLVLILQSYWQSLDACTKPDEHQLKQRAIALRIAEQSKQRAVPCLCHNDVHHLNLIDDGRRLWLLDWEYAGIGDPYFDLASVCCYHGFSEAQRNTLLASYYTAEAALHQQARLQLMCWLFDYIKDLWFSVRAL